MNTVEENMLEAPDVCYPYEMIPFAKVHHGCRMRQPDGTLAPCDKDCPTCAAYFLHKAVLEKPR